MMSLAIEVAPDRRKDGLALGELVSLVQQAMRDDYPMDSSLKVVVGMRGQIRTLTVIPPKPEDVL